MTEHSRGKRLNRTPAVLLKPGETIGLSGYTSLTPSAKTIVDLDRIYINGQELSVNPAAHLMAAAELHLILSRYLDRPENRNGEIGGIAHIAIRVLAEAIL